MHTFFEAKHRIQQLFRVARPTSAYAMANGYMRLIQQYFVFHIEDWSAQGDVDTCGSEKSTCVYLIF